MLNLLLLLSLVTPEESLRFEYAYKQGFDTSCGVAVTASLLNYYWNTPITKVSADIYTFPQGRPVTIGLLYGHTFKLGEK